MSSADAAVSDVGATLGSSPEEASLHARGSQNAVSGRNEIRGDVQESVAICGGDRRGTDIYDSAQEDILVGRDAQIHEDVPSGSDLRQGAPSSGSKIHGEVAQEDEAIDGDLPEDEALRRGAAFEDAAAQGGAPRSSEVHENQTVGRSAADNMAVIRGVPGDNNRGPRENVAGNRGVPEVNRGVQEATRTSVPADPRAGGDCSATQHRLAQAEALRAARGFQVRPHQVARRVRRSLHEQRPCLVINGDVMLTVHRRRAELYVDLYGADYYEAMARMDNVRNLVPDEKPSLGSRILGKVGRFCRKHPVATRAAVFAAGFYVVNKIF